MKEPVSVFWFRRDLRMEDNAGLYHALIAGHSVVPVFIFDREILDHLGNKSDRRVIFIHRQLSALNEKLAAAGSALNVFYDEPSGAWKNILSEYNVKNVFVNEDYEPYARSRDAMISELLKKYEISISFYTDQVIHNPLKVLRDNGQPYTVFTPYKNKWLSLFTPEATRTFPSEKVAGNFYRSSTKPVPSLQSIGFKDTGELFAAPVFAKELLHNYADRRNFPGMDSTSRLSVHIRFGTVSIRTLMAAAFELSQSWMNELVWREFYMMILWHFPHAAGSAFKSKYNFIRWRNDENDFETWCSGMTGYPLVDAGMRELNETGFMHNRLRMVTASFLTKHLLIDWRWGEAYFASRLLDFELSSNNGGWQWVAGSGCDAAPYFRIFNPIEQAKKFDPDSVYIKRWVPDVGKSSYPSPVIDHKEARSRCMKTYSEALTG